MTWADLSSTFPELALVVTALALLLLEVLNSPPRSRMVWVALAGLGVALALELALPAEGTFYQGMIAVDRFTRYFDVLFLVITAATMLIAIPYLRATLEERGEYFALLLLATVGMMFMVKAHDLTIVFLGLELLSISLYVLVAFYRHRVRSNEAGIKYLLLGAFSSGFFLMGIALLYGSTAATNYDAIRQSIISGTQLSPMLTLAGFGLLLVGFAFKVALVPFHMYAPDVYEGAPTSITAFLTTGPKVAGFAALLKVIVVSFAVTTQHWSGIIAILAALTMTVGNLTALMQDNLKRMLAFSSVAHAGYLAVAILVGTYDAAFALAYYLAIYSVTTLGAFAVVSLIEGDKEANLSIDSYRGLGKRSPYAAGVFALTMASLAGLPPTAGFLGKYFVFSAAMDEGYLWLVVVAVLNSLVSVYYYVRPVVAMYMQSPVVDEPIVVHRAIVPVLLLVVVVVLGLGLLPMPLVKNGVAAANSLF